ncbi:MAG: fimbrillin family protein [Muribaculaceae bacterium]|nr:fimbrillin family protein [Muribaculaceae bacterium]
MIRHTGILKLMAAAACILGVQGCTDDVAPEQDYTPEIKVAARIATHVATRGYQEQGPVTEGKYFLSYPQNNQARNYTVAIVDFDLMGAETPGLGIVHTLAGNELKWSDIGGSPVTFYLDNVSQTFGTDTLVTLSPATNPYVAGVFDSTGGTNDLLWGEKAVNSGTPSIGFDLHHYMSRVKVQVEVVHEDNSVEDITLAGAKVRITNLYPKTVAYNRSTGALTLDEEDASGITIVDPTLPGYDWADTDESNPDRTMYLSPDIVLPPQALAEDASRSQLEIELANGDVYTGILPHAMMIANSTDNSLNYPVTLAFLKEYILTIHTVITEEPPELAFMPVWVTDWVDKGEFTLEAHQSGIYTAAEFIKLTEYYSKNNEYQLVRYGYLETPEGETQKKWLFNFFSSVVLNFNSIYNTMHPGVEVPDKGVTKDFSFQFNNYAEYVTNGNDEEMVKVTPDELYRIVTGTLDWNGLTR